MYEIFILPTFCSVIFSKHTDVYLAPEHVVYLTFLGVVTMGGFERGGVCCGSLLCCYSENCQLGISELSLIYYIRFCRLLPVLSGMSRSLL